MDLTLENAKLRLPLVETVRERHKATVDAGHGREGVAAVYETEQ